MQETQVQSLGQEDPLEKETATHSSIPACRIPWTEEPGELQFMGLQRVRHNWVTNTTTTTKYWRADIGNKSCITWEEEVEQISLKKERDEDKR